MNIDNFYMCTIVIIEETPFCCAIVALLQP
jgi:hypothetical protein